MAGALPTQRGGKMGARNVGELDCAGPGEEKSDALAQILALLGREPSI